ncbi:hypothetical protein [Limnoglobus roseus]|uniref:hypothetical protein n=1 Tax=Limnoglobus roseus TaxID=2598579 RepID=UPI0011EB51EA|nr:hypothetical protein [Limnoglobus roseus]
MPLLQPVESEAEFYRRTHLDMKRCSAGARPYNAKYTNYSYAQTIERASGPRTCGLAGVRGEPPPNYVGVG